MGSGRHRGDLADSASLGRDPHCRWSFKRGAVLRQRWTIDDGVADSAVPAGVPAAAVTKARLMADEHLAGSEPVAAWAVRRRVRDPLPGRGLY